MGNAGPATVQQESPEEAHVRGPDVRPVPDVDSAQRPAGRRGTLFRDINAGYAEAMNYAGIDRLTASMLYLHFAALVAHAAANSVLGLGDAFPSPFAWRPISPLAAWVVVGLGAAATAGPLLLRRWGVGHYAWRLAATAALTAYSGLFIFVSGGAIEAHFHVFIAMAYLAIYADWRLGWVALALVGAHHTLVAAIDPSWVYFYGFNPLAPLAHAGAVTVTAGLLTFLCEIHRSTVRRLKRTREALEHDIKERAKAQQELDAARGQLTAHEKLATMGTLVSGVAHEVRTPLTYVSNHLHLLRWKLGRVNRKDPETRALVESMAGSSEAALEGVDRIRQLVGNLRRHAQLQAGERRRLPLDRVVAEATQLFEATHRGQILVRTRLGSGVEAALDRVQVQQVVLNLMENAADAMARGGTLEVETRAADGGAEIVVRDEGAGIPDEVRERMFDPLYTTKPHGTGMGLSIIHRIVHDHGGHVQCETGSGRGTTFVVWIPADAGPEA